MGRPHGNRGLIYFLQETAIVVIGVLIAFSINRFSENLANERYLEKTFQAIEQEVRLNQAQMDSILKRHLQFYEEVENRRDSSQLSLGEFLIDLGGVQGASQKNISLRFFIAHKADLLDYDLLIQLIEIEESQKLLERKTTQLVDYAVENINDRSSECKLQFSYLLANVIDSEMALSEGYGYFLEAHQSELQTAVDSSKS